MAAVAGPDTGSIAHHAPAVDRWKGAVVAAAGSIAILVGGGIAVPGGWVVGAIGLLPATALGWRLGSLVSALPTLGDSVGTILMMSIGVVILGDVVVSVAWSISGVFGLGATEPGAGIGALAWLPVLMVAGMCFVAWWIVVPVALAATVWWAVVRIWSRRDMGR